MRKLFGAAKRRWRLAAAISRRKRRPFLFVDPRGHVPAPFRIPFSILIASSWRRTGLGWFVDHLNDDRLPLGDLYATSVGSDVDRFVQCRDQEFREVLAARAARVARPSLLERLLLATSGRR